MCPLPISPSVVTPVTNGSTDGVFPAPAPREDAPPGRDRVTVGPRPCRERAHGVPVDPESFWSHGVDGPPGRDDVVEGVEEDGLVAADDGADHLQAGGVEGDHRAAAVAGPGHLRAVGGLRLVEQAGGQPVRERDADVDGGHLSRAVLPGGRAVGAHAEPDAGEPAALDRPAAVAVGPTGVHERLVGAAADELEVATAVDELAWHDRADRVAV